MTRETRIALLVGLAFIVLFGLVLGQRSMNLQSQTPALATNVGPAGGANTASTEDNRPSNELANSSIGDSAHAVLPAAPTPSDAAPSRVPTAADAHVAVAPSPGHAATPTPSAIPSPAKPEAEVTQVPANPAQGHHAIVTGGPKPDDSNSKNVIDIAGADAPAGKTYTVQPGDSIFKIAKKLDLGNSGPGKIMAMNKDRIKDFTAIKVGQEILVPADDAAKVTPAKAEVNKADLPANVANAVKKAATNDPAVVVPTGRPALAIQDGKKAPASDVPALSPNAKPTLASGDKKPSDDKVLVAKGTKGDVEATLSRLQDDMHVAAPGDKAASPDKLDDKLNGKADGAVASKTYTVRHGDSLYSIAGDQMGSRTKAAVQKLMQANGIKDPSKLTAGAELKIPKA